jgi:hypothetical protein
MKSEDAAKTSHDTGPIKVMTVREVSACFARASDNDLPTAETRSDSGLSRGQRLALQHRSHRPLAHATEEAGRLADPRC